MLYLNSRRQKVLHQQKKKGGINMMKNVVNIIQPVIEDRVGKDFKGPLSQNIKSTITSPEIVRKKVTCNRNVENKICEDDMDVMHFLASVKSYNSYANDRMAQSFVSKESARKILEKKIEKKHLENQNPNKIGKL